MSSSASNTSPQSQPISIDRRRQRSASESSVDSAFSDAAATPAASADGSPPRVKVQTSPSTSPVLSYFFPASPIAKSPIASFVKANPVLEDDETETVLPASAHARRLSNTWTTGARPGLANGNGDDRSAGLLRRLSLGSAFGRPPMPSAGAGGPSGAPVLSQPLPRTSRPRRSATVAVTSTSTTVTHKPRAPSPMGERILKGHFDGFV
ncbi:hypothetical protein AURDEDRAFT_112421 [Auricularia subglabra TFB-10046 SS5]|nr:hypothetical protein AURDEDRAFT_112421 [Auricularia subglabra TFB-10046 SS5]